MKECRYWMLTAWICCYTVEHAWSLSEWTECLINDDDGDEL